MSVGESVAMDRSLLVAMGQSLWVGRCGSVAVSVGGSLQVDRCIGRLVGRLLRVSCCESVAVNRLLWVSYCGSVVIGRPLRRVSLAISREAPYRIW